MTEESIGPEAPSTAGQTELKGESERRWARDGSPISFRLSPFASYRTETPGFRDVLLDAVMGVEVLE